MLDAARVVEIASRLAGLYPGQLYSGVGRKATRWRNAVICALVDELSFEPDEVALTFQVCEATIRRAVRCADRVLVNKIVAAVEADRAGVSEPLELEWGLSTVVSALNEVGLKLGQMVSLIMELRGFLEEVYRACLEQLTAGDARQRELSALVAAGWGDTPQPEIPERVLEQARAGVFVEAPKPVELPLQASDCGPLVLSVKVRREKPRPAASPPPSHPQQLPPVERLVKLASSLLQ